MNPDFEREQREIEREMAALADRLDAPAPRPECVARIKAAVVAEARRVGERRRRFLRLRPLLGVAAAALLLVCLSVPWQSRDAEPLAFMSDNPDVVFENWVDALDASEERFTRLMGDDWLFEASAWGDENGNVDPLDSLEDSLESFETIIGA